MKMKTVFSRSVLVRSVFVLSSFVLSTLLLSMTLLATLSGSMSAQDQAAKDQNKTPATLKSILLEQLRTTHNQKDWFVDANTAVAGLTAEQASWKTTPETHSVGQLTNHLVFWNQRELAKFKGETLSKFSGDNDETFNNFDSKKWAATVQQLDSVLTEWEKVVTDADDKKLQAWYSTIAHVGTHNAYHVGQIVLIRKLQGSWDPDKGVK